MSDLCYQYPESILHGVGKMAPSVKYSQEWRTPQAPVYKNLDVEACEMA